jgi:hypothetical protein
MTASSTREVLAKRIMEMGGRRMSEADSGLRAWLSPVTPSARFLMDHPELGAV